MNEQAYNGLAKLLSEHYGSFGDPIWSTGVSGFEADLNTDHLYNLSDSILIFGIAFHPPREAQRWARGFKRYMERFAAPGLSTSNGLKVDGSGFHHSSDNNHYLAALKTYIGNLELLKNTGIQISPSAYKSFRNEALRQTVASKKGMQPFSMCGRSPNETEVTIGKNQLKALALVGGSILGTGRADPDLAHIYNDTFGIDAAFETRSKQSLSGAYQFNYSAQGVCRESDWTAVVRGHTSVLWGCEGFPEDNRYGRYQSYGALQVLYPGGALRGNGYSHVGWDWNYNPGTTAIVLPFTKLRAYRERLDERQKFDFVGASTLHRTDGDVFRETRGEYGMFAMKFQQVENQGFRAVIGPNSHDASFKFKKSTFYFGDYIIALGSNIENHITRQKSFDLHK